MSLEKGVTGGDDDDGDDNHSPTHFDNIGIVALLVTSANIPPYPVAKTTKETNADYLPPSVEEEVQAIVLNTLAEATGAKSTGKTDASDNKLVSLTDNNIDLMERLKSLDDPISDEECQSCCKSKSSAKDNSEWQDHSNEDFSTI